MRRPPTCCRSSPGRVWRGPALLAPLFCGLLCGCAAITNPVANGVPMHRLSTELLGEPKEGTRPLPLTYLRQKPPETYRLAPHDVLAIWVEGVLGEKNQIPPVLSLTESRSLPPAVGFPIPIRSDGTVQLPLLPPLALAGMTIEEAQVAVRDAYTKGDILQPGRERVLVSLLRRRVEQILVFREDYGGQNAPTSAAGASTRSFGVTLSPGGGGTGLKRGAGFAVDLPAYENDVLHALAATGGLPGLDAVNEIVIQRGYFQDGADTEVVPPESGARGQGRGVRGQESAVRSQRSGVRDQEDVPSVVINRVAALLPERADHAGSEVRARPLEVLPSDSTLQKAAAAWKADGQRQATRLRKNHGTELASLPQDACDSDSHQILQGGHTIRIPLRLRPGQMPSIRPEDIVLHTGDIVYIEAREAEYFYTGGLLPPGQFTIPRDYDLDVVQAIAMVGGPLLSGGVNPINLAGTTLNSGIGFPSPSLVSVLRRTPDGRQVTIRIDLNQALRDPRERILIQPRDVVLLQERPSEAMARYFTNVVKFTFDWMLIHGPHETGSTNVAVP